MFRVVISYGYSNAVVLGPADTRDEASRLARAWLDAYRPTATAASNQVYDVLIERVVKETR